MTGSESDSADGSVGTTDFSNSNIQGASSAVNIGDLDLNLDALAMSSLQNTATAILAQQQKDPHFGWSSLPSESESELGKNGKGSSETSTCRASTGKLRRTLSLTKGGGHEKIHHIERHMWSQDETNALVDGCNKYGVGNWKAILNDEELSGRFKGRIPGDLKDRFRTYFPDAYHDLYPNAKTHTSQAVRSKAPDGSSIFEKGKTKERRPFTPAEDDVLKRGYQQHGSHWAVIAREPVFEGRRKSTDLRDRFRNAFPELYQLAGYKARTRSTRKDRRQSSSSSMTHGERVKLLASELDPGIYEQNGSRPSLVARSETSTSVNSQAVSEQSEGEESSDFHDSQALSDISAVEKFASHPASRSQSFGAMSSHSVRLQQTSGLHQGGAPTMSTKQPLRRSHSTKRGASKIHSTENAIRTASLKSNREAVLASHHHHNMQHPHAPHVLHEAKPHQANELPQSQPGSEQYAHTWVDRFPWEQNNDAVEGSTSITSMDLDEMNDIMNSQSAAHLLDQNVDIQRQERQVTEQINTASSPNSDTNLLASLFWNTENQGSPNNRIFPVDSFQDLLDPLGPTVSGTSLTNAPSFVWTPVSSSSAPVHAPVSAPTGATRREHEHNQWAGDLLHRGTFAGIEPNDHDFVSMASMQLPEEVAQRDLEHTQTLQPSPGSRDTDHSAIDNSRPPSVNDLISKTARRQSQPPPLLGPNEETQPDNQFQSPYRNPYPYPADDMSLINPLLGGSMTLFPSLMGSGSAGEGGVRRRRSTDTVRESAFGLPSGWRESGEALGLTAVDSMHVDHDHLGTKDTDISGQSDHHSRSLSSESEMLPSRAASVGDMDLVAGREDALYAESLPDLTSASFGGEPSTESDTAFSTVPHLQMSYDDMDLPTFLNRSPNIAHASASSIAPHSPRLNLNNENNWLKTLGQRSFQLREPPRDDLDHTPFSPRPGMANRTNPMTHAIFSNRINDAGALDRLEHLYLEGLHTPGSPLPFSQGQSYSSSHFAHDVAFANSDRPLQSSATQTRNANAHLMIPTSSSMQGPPNPP